VRVGDIEHTKYGWYQCVKVITPPTARSATAEYLMRPITPVAAEIELACKRYRLTQLPWLVKKHA
jgi:hypothetical protein